MRLNRFLGALVAVVLVVPALVAAEDLTGTWTGTFATSINGGASNDDAVHMVAKQAGAELTGTIGPNADQQWAIQKGTIAVATVDGKETTKVTFDVQLEGGGPQLHFDLELIGGHLKGKANAEMDGMTMAAVVDMARTK